MKRDGQAIILYSIGRNLEDDGGEPSAPDKHDGDITFRLP
jgi:hypothetical protein